MIPVAPETKVGNEPQRNLAFYAQRVNSKTHADLLGITQKINGRSVNRHMPEKVKFFMISEYQLLSLILTYGSSRK